jgi:[ribosomal protein S18]-alanine N-acetyltransferase
MIEAMRLSDIPAVSAIERLSFPQPWPQSAYRREIVENRMAYYVVARQEREDLETAAPPSAPPPPQPIAQPALPGEEGLLGRLQRLFRAQDESTTSNGDRSVVGYAGLWLMSDEAHVTTIAVHPEHRGKRVGELLLLHLIDRGLVIGARWVTLEVRVTNTVAQSLYRKYTFKEMGVRRRYYSDNGEDALIMWTDALDSDRFREVLQQNREMLQQKMAEAE